MKPLDKQFLSLQFRNKIYSKNGTEFQSFFEDIMEKVFLDFRKIRPYGNMGDGGNDGYRKDAGIYYQVHAPIDPKLKERDAANKLYEDFQKLKNEWDEISNVEEYNFVYNDKYGGSVQLLEEAITKLKRANSDIDFNLYLAKDLESDFFRLSGSDILDLGFNIDRRQAIEITFSYLENVRKELDRENAVFAQKILENSKEIVLESDDDRLALEYEILESICLQKFEKFDEARDKYENISRRFPDDPRPVLYLAESYLHIKNVERNLELLEKAEKLDESFWLLELEQVIRKLNFGEKINTGNVDEKVFPNDPRIKASFYRLYGLLLDHSGDQQRADSFIEKAIILNPDRFSNYLDKISLLENRMLFAQDSSQQLQMSKDLLELINDVERKFNQYGDIGSRNQAMLNVIKLSALLVQENISEFEHVSQHTFEMAINCYFDVRIENVLVRILQAVFLPDSDLNKLLEYLLGVNMLISDNLSNTLVSQFNERGTLYDDGREFFEKIQNQKYVDFIDDLKNKNDDKVLSFLSPNVGFAVKLVNTLKDSPKLRRKIIEDLPNDDNIQKEKLKMLLSFDEKEYDEAYKILRGLDLSNLCYLECRPMLQVAQQKKAWDFEIILLDKLLEKERNEREIFNLKSLRFNAFLNLKRFPEVIEIGAQLLNDDAINNYLGANNKEALLTNTIFACIERGKVDETAITKAQELLEKYPLENPSYEFKAGVEARVYLRLGEAKKALGSVIEGVKIKKVFSPQEYASLHFLFVDIGNRIELKLESLRSVQENTFLKLSNKGQWYYVGSENELDAIHISETHNKFRSFLNKQLGDEVVSDNKYGSGKNGERIEYIFSIEQYVLWQTLHNFQKLAKDGDLDGVQMINVPQIEGAIDLKNVLKFFEHLSAKSEPIFEMYCDKPIPLAMLAVSEGGLTGAIGRIQQENRGFLKGSDGTNLEREKQIQVARKVLRQELPFYIDGTSALFLSELGVLQKIIEHLPNLKVPQSVIAFLADVTERFRYIPGHSGYMGYAQGRITVSNVDKNRSNLIRSNFITSIRLLEDNPANIRVISLANKVDCFSEREVPAELCDACILAQEENSPVLTDDFLYLQINEMETGKNAPEYFSSWALMRVLYDAGLITFREYLDFFGYLSGYRYRFLPLHPEDIQLAVFGDGDEKIIAPENIRTFNFPLTLSEEYGVSYDTVFRVIGVFLLRILLDNDIAIDSVEKVFVEIIESLPKKINKRDFSRMLVGVCNKLFEKNKPQNLCWLEDKLRHQKFDALSRLIESFSSEVMTLTPLKTNER